MFIVDKYDNLNIHQDIVNRLLNSFDTHNEVYENINNIVNKPNDEFNNIIKNIEYGKWKYSNLQHLIIYGQSGSGKNLIIKYLLEKIYGKNNIKTDNVEYTINGYSNTKTKVYIKQSKNHIIIEPNNNGFDKYLIQEIIQNYAKTEILNILKYKKLYKIVIIDKIDDLSYTAQASLRRTMELYSDNCKFIFVCNQLSKIIEPLRSRCLLIRIPKPTNNMLTNILLEISIKENIELTKNDFKEIIIKSQKNIYLLLWLLEFKKYNCNYEKTWITLIDKIVELICDKSNYNTKSFNKIIQDIREYIYILFITNISFNTIIKNIMIKLINKFNDIKLKYNIIELTSEYEKRISEGTRNIIHLEAYILKLFNLL
jgi:replication factor C subunit 3/5